jgi:hypothetical protein
MPVGSVINKQAAGAYKSRPSEAGIADFEVELEKK